MRPGNISSTIRWPWHLIGRLLRSEGGASAAPTVVRHTTRSYGISLFAVPIITFTRPHLLAQSTCLPSIPPCGDQPGHTRRAYAVHGKYRYGKGSARQYRALIRYTLRRSLTHSDSSVFDDGAAGAASRDSARISRTLCQTNQLTNPSMTRMIGTSKGRVTDRMSS